MFALLAVALLMPLLIHAQAESADLSATIRAAILSDPRTAAMSEEDISAMVGRLSKEAEEQGVNSYDITWRPQEPTEASGALAAKSCGMPAFFCSLNSAFGLDGSDVTMPITLGISAALLLFVIGSMLHHTFGHHPVMGNLKTGGLAP